MCYGGFPRLSGAVLTPAPAAAPPSQPSPLSHVFKRSYTEHTNSGGTVEISVRTKADRSVGDRSLDTAAKRLQLQTYLAKAPCQAALRTAPKAAQNLHELIDNATYVEFDDHGRRCIYGMEYEYTMSAEFDGHALSYTWSYELYSDSD